MSLPSFFAPAPAGTRCLNCAHCGNWVWWPADEELTDETRRHGRVFCPTRRCEAAEGAARDATVCRICDGAAHGVFACPFDPRDESDDRSCEVSL